MTRLLVHQCMEAVASASPRGDPLINAHWRLTKRFPQNHNKLNGWLGHFHISILHTIPHPSQLIFLFLTNRSGFRVQNPIVSADFSLSHRQQSTFNIHAVTHFINGEGFFSAHLHFSHYRRPRNGSCCRGCMTNILIDHSFTCCPRRYIMSWKSLRKLLPTELCAIFLAM